MSLPLAVLPMLPPPEIRTRPPGAPPPVPARDWRGHAVLDEPVRRDGVEVFRGATSWRWVDGRLAQVLVRTSADAPAGGTFPPPGITRSVARELGADVEAEAPVWFPTADGLVAARRGQLGGGWEVVIDGEGALRWLSGPPQAEGAVSVRHHPRLPTDPLVTSPLSGAVVVGASGDAVTDDAGAWSLADGPFVLSLQGPHVSVEDRQGADLAVALAGGDEVVDAPDDLSELDAFVHVGEIRAAWSPLAPDHPWLAGEVMVDVDQGLAACNAYFLGWTLHFYRPVPSCHPPAQHADVVFHEWGHGLHDKSILSGVFDLAVSEGVADVVAWRRTGDDVIARGLFVNGDGMRDLSELRRWPDDVDEVEPHETGRIVSGALRDLALSWADEPPDTFESFLLSFLAVGPRMESALDDARFADDDDGNLQNGTPHECDLARAFGRHGYGPLTGGFGRVEVSHAPPSTAVAGAPTEVVLDVDASVLPTCVEAAGDDVVLTVVVDGAAPIELAVEGRGRELRAELPAAPAGAIVEWRFDGAVEGQDVALPEDGGFYALTVPGEPDGSTPGPGDDPGDDPDDPGAGSGAAPAAGCGCAAPGGGAGGLLAGLALALVRRRRR